MYFEQADLLRGMSRDFVKEFMDHTVKKSYKKGYVLFQEGKRARYFYILLTGCVKLSIGETGHTVYTVDHPGEAFGWSSLVGRDTYSAWAECTESTKLLKINVKSLHKILEKDPASGLLFFRHLAGTLGNRLLQTYKMITGISQAEMSLSFGSGQILESQATFS